MADAGDGVSQSAVFNEIHAAPGRDAADTDAFNDTHLSHLSLSFLKRCYMYKDDRVLALLDTRHSIKIDDEFSVPVGAGKVHISTDVTTIDFHLTVANDIGFASILPNEASNHRFSLELDLQKPARKFKGKHALVGFDTKERVLYIGRSMNEDIFLAMAPNDFFEARFQPCAAGHSTGPSLMSTRHYRQVVMMIVHFLSHIPERSYSNQGNIYTQDLVEEDPKWRRITDTLCVLPSQAFSFACSSNAHSPLSVSENHPSSDSTLKRCRPLTRQSNPATATG